MKLKNILSAVIASVTVLAASSCEDMLKVDSKIVMYDYQNTLDHATDTVYSVMGIIKQLQKIADRTVILGEIRGDLVEITDHANDDLADLYRFDYANLKSTNRYNKPVDFYSVINNCNYFLAHADTAYIRNHKNVFLKEYITVLSYRAWTYLQMAQIYGKVYFVDKPILSGDDANESKWDYLGIKEVAARLLADFEERFMDYDLPDYGSLGGETTGSGDKSESHTSTELFIPVRIIMGDLALWSEQYEKAASYYHDFLSYNEKAVPVATASVSWFGNDFIYLGDDTYAKTLGKNGKPICYIPMEADEYSGLVSDLPNVFNSTKDNDYWYQLTRSQALTSLSTRQTYCYHDFNSRTGYESPKYIEDKTAQEVVLRRGDLRLQSILELKASDDDDEFSSSKLSSERQTLNKINPEKICLYRNDVVYLRLAEALNRAELPQTAFAVLKYGLCKEVIDSISQVEKDRAAAKGISNVYVFNDNKFMKAQYDYKTETKMIDGLSVTKQTTYLVSGDRYNTFGIHARGCGDAAMDTTFVINLPVGSSLKDSIRFVEEKIIDEMGLETCFEGYRFGDLMRVSMHRGADSGDEFDTDFLARRVASRASATMEDPYAQMDADLYAKLLGDGKTFNRNWFLRLTDK
ncbi:MAG: hypothetical protein ACSW76_03150 [Bacteroidaceae bacterium]